MGLDFKETYVMFDHNDSEFPIILIVLAPRFVDMVDGPYLQVKFASDMPGHGGHSIPDPTILEERGDGMVRLRSSSGKDYRFELLTVALLERYFPQDAADMKAGLSTGTDEWLRWWFYEQFVSEDHWPETLP